MTAAGRRAAATVRRTVRRGQRRDPPELIHRAPRRYTAQATRAKIEGATLLAGVVGVDGTLRDIRGARSLDATFGRDDEAIDCVRRWRCRPGTRQRKPVGGYVTIEVAFELR